MTSRETHSTLCAAKLVIERNALRFTPPKGDEIFLAPVLMIVPGKKAMDPSSRWANLKTASQKETVVL